MGLPVGAYGEPVPWAVEASGATLPIDGSWRANAALSLVPRDTEAGRAELMEGWFGDGWRGLPDPGSALAAACEWHDSAWSQLAYGTGLGGAGRVPPRRLLDLGDDAAIVRADFLRLYRMDLSSPALSGMGWHEFVGLLLALMRTGGSLVAAAVSARAYDGGARGAARERAEALLEAWALPPSESELIEMARAAF